MLSSLLHRRLLASDHSVERVGVVFDIVLALLENRFDNISYDPLVTIAFFNLERFGLFGDDIVIDSFSLAIDGI